MNAQARQCTRSVAEISTAHTSNELILASDRRYIVRLANAPEEIASALRLRHKVFNRELGVPSRGHSQLDFDPFDLRCKHLIAVERTTGEIIGTYRLNTLMPAEPVDRLYSNAEFSIENLPLEVLHRGVEIGRACIAREHRGSKALFLLWKGLASFVKQSRKRYLFGCCSIFSHDKSVGARAFEQLVRSNDIHEQFRLTPRANAIDIDKVPANFEPVDLPALFEMYLKLGAKVCGPPMYDEAFGTIDFFVIFDLEKMTERYRRIFFA